MARLNTGSLNVRTLADGTRVFRLRFHAEGRRQITSLHERHGCDCGCGGGWDEPGAHRELAEVLARIKLGVWKRPTGALRARRAGPGTDFEEYARRWLHAKTEGMSGEIRASTASYYRWCIERHLLSVFGDCVVEEIDRARCLQFKARLVGDARELREAIAAGRDLRDRRGRRRVPLGAASIRKVLRALAAILEDAVEDELIEHNPARGKRMRVKVPKPERTFLEMDELALLLDAAGAQDLPLQVGEPERPLGPRAAQVERLLGEGYRPRQIAKRLGVTPTTVSSHVRRLNMRAGRGYAGRRAAAEILARSGVRVSELCDLRIGQVRLHGCDGGRFRIAHAKTETGIREVQMTPELAAVVSEHIKRLRRIGAPTGLNAYLLQNLRGGRTSRGRVAGMLAKASARASEQQLAKGLPPLPRTSPHTLRRTYISIALVANSFDVKWVMAQVGHADSRMTMHVYAQLEQRAKREHGESFDRLIRQARQSGGEQLTAGAA
ncbi:MAG: tyrosine-type recombinase/integrase [Solirubrobacteraceae bacterium]